MQFVNFLKKQLIKVKHLFKIQLLVDNNPMGCFLYSEIFQISNFFLAHQLLIKILADFFMENGFVKSMVLGLLAAHVPNFGANFFLNFFRTTNWDRVLIPLYWVEDGAMLLGIL